MAATEDTVFLDGNPCVVLDSVRMSYTVSSTAVSPLDDAPLFRRILNKSLGRQSNVRVDALNELSLVVERGESVGIIGRNGSGKSTMMKLISGQESATSGAVYASSTPIMLGVNAALVPDLSGDQNVILGCLAMGMERSVIDEKFDSIVELSGLEKSIHLPMKSYSSGMGSRLRFAIAAAVNPEILLVDEALNTGDAQFVDRSRKRMDELRRNAGCVFLVSHSLSTIEDMCSRTIWIDQGDLIMDGEPKETTRAYKDFTDQLAKGNNKSAAKLKAEARSKLTLTEIRPRVQGRRVGSSS
ncbi:ATP-binding cassette domain-containing protein [Arthrobacter sp. AL08]|uniref:ABC transporter ATP-binding protein n=1 Tax=unclassified Arthrobacter TaxID=235627 RepID=UPI00249C5035|nr:MULTISPECIES: ATP-binding cassette domain-containing protein [unclassified Arthrobacter]MDI3242487.1 ATP-binding cassette domain-containing protein [Arthrobacter sp. AL05]MDI3278517.1 ATP-binding cassette domain-containing protein [Arthrobacter sp. AL08]